MDNIELNDDEIDIPDETELDADSLSDSEPVEPEILQQNEDDGKHEEEKEYGQKVQKRINKIIAERNVERDENRKLREKYGQLEAKFSEQEKSDVNTRAADIKKRKMEFMDEGDYEKAEELNDELLDLKIKQNNRQQEPQYQPEQQQQPNVPDAQQKWIEGNDWYGANNGSSARARYANDLYVEIVNEGYDPNDPDTYSELDNRLGNTPKKPDRQPPPGQSAPDRGAVTGSSKSSKFTQKDFNTMREYGLDPNDKAQVGEWLKNKGGK